MLEHAPIRSLLKPFGSERVPYTNFLGAVQLCFLCTVAKVKFVCISGIFVALLGTLRFRCQPWQRKARKKPWIRRQQEIGRGRERWNNGNGGFNM